MNKLFVTTAIAVVGFVSVANATSVTVGDLTVSQNGALTTQAFDNNGLGVQNGTSTALTNLGAVGFSFTTDGAVVQGTQSDVYAAPAGDTSRYLYLDTGATITFNKAISGFYIYWGSIDSTFENPAHNNAITILGDSVGANDLAPAISDGLGNQTNANDNQWFYVSDSNPFTTVSFSNVPSTPAFEFDLAAVPEPSTWAMMGLGFMGLFLAARSRKSARAIA